MKYVEVNEVWNAIIDTSGVEHGQKLDEKLMTLIKTIVATGRAFGHLTVNSEACTYINNRLWHNKLKAEDGK